MADDLRLPITPPTVPEGFCNNLGVDWVQTIVNLMGQSVALLGSGSGAGTIILNQSGTPGPDQRNFLWRKPDGRIYQYISGAWIVPHPYPPNAKVGFWAEMTPNDIWAFDGGDGSDPSIVTPTGNVGAMWVIDHDYDGRSPMGPGAIPTSFPAKTLSLSENVGEGAHTQDTTEMSVHSHTPDPTQADGFLCHGLVPGSFNILGGTDTIKLLQTASAGGSGTPPVTQPMNVTHPVRGAYFIIRSGRVNYVG